MTETAHHVQQGGDPLSFNAGDGVTVTKLSVGRMDNNAWLLVRGEDVVLIDAASEPERLLELLDGRRPSAIVTTHRHWDHTGALAALVDATGSEALAGTPDVEAIRADTGVAGRGVWDGDTIPLGAGSLQVVGLVGHTPGAIAVVHAPSDGPAHLFTGDSLFPGGVGKTGSAADFASLLGDVTTKLFDRFGDDTQVHPGHGDDTTLGAERPHLDEWRTRGW